MERDSTMSTGDDIPDRRVRCECGDWDEDHDDACAACDELYHPFGQGDCIGGWDRRIQVICPDGSGEFRRAVRPDRGDR